MREVIQDVRRWRGERESIALATVVSTWGSAPRRPGAKLAVTADARMAGSVSGGCVEGAVVETGMEVLASGRPRLLSFGVADETAWSVGLACGGEVRVFVEALAPEVEETVDGWLRSETGGTVATVVAGSTEALGRKLLIGADGHRSGGIAEALDDEIAAAARAAFRRRASRGASFSTESTGGDEIEVFLDVILPRTTLILVGGVHISIALAHLARTLEMRTVLVEPRAAFGSAERFPHVDRRILDWPREAFAEVPLTPATAVAVLTHDPKIDDPALEAVLDSGVFYIGALGSRGTQEKRRRRFLEKGYSAEQLDRIHGPIGLDIGAATPEEIALAILAEVVSRYRCED